jgi:hypothetical protein
MFCKSDVETAAKPANVSTGHGGVYITGYRKLWRLQ